LTGNPGRCVKDKKYGKFILDGLDPETVLELCDQLNATLKESARAF